MIQRIFYLFVFTLPLSAVTLDGLIHYAMEHSNVIKQSKTQSELARLKHQESRADQFGSIDLVGSYNHYNLPRTLAPLTPAVIATDPLGVATTKDMYSMGVTYAVPLFTGFAQTRQIEMDALASSLAQSKLSLTKEQLAYNVGSLYLSILAFQDMAQAQKKHVEALKRLRDTIASEVSLGKKAKVDLLKAENDLYGNISYLEVLKSNVAITKASLASLVGMDHLGKLKSVNVTVRKARYSIADLMHHAESLNRIKISEYNVKKAKKGVQKSESTLMPQVSLNSYFGYNYGENDPTNPRAGDWANEQNWQVGVNAKWTVFDFGKRDATIQKAKVAKMQAESDKIQAVMDLQKLLIEAQQKIRQAYANYQGNVKQYALAKASEKIERVRYENGVSTINDLLYAVSQTQLSKAKLIESKYNYQKGKFYMDYLLEKGVTK
jgi:outer membrane protein TolC